jgi:hypothetical protein
MRKLISQTFLINNRYRLELIRNGSECAIELLDTSIDRKQIIEMEDKDMRAFIAAISDSPYIFSSNN